MPKMQYMVNRRGTYYLRLRVPKDLVTAIGKPEISRTLGTSNAAEAKRKLHEELTHIYARFDTERRRMPVINKRNMMLADLTKTQLTSLVFRWLERMETKSNQYIDTPGEEHAREVRETLLEERGLLSSDLADRDFNLVRGAAQHLLDENGIKFKRSSSEFQGLLELLMRANIELVNRSLRNRDKDLAEPEDPIFASYNIQGYENAFKAKNAGMTFGGLCDVYIKDHRGRLGLRGLEAMNEQIKVLRELVGAEINLIDVTSELCREVFDWIKALPAHPSKKYPGVSLRKAIEKSNKDGSPKLGPTRINTYMARLRSLFTYAVSQRHFLGLNPVSDLFMVPDKRKARDLRHAFSIEQLKKILNHDIFQKAAGTQIKYSPAGKGQARFWVPLIALWTGMRLEEICQLDVEDVKKINEIDVIRIEASDTKKIKNDASERIIPIHSELKKMGFLLYVDSVRQAGKGKLFPEMKVSSRGSYSPPFSKWFARFLTELNIDDHKLVFHSFRHNFRNALDDAEVPSLYVRLLGGWKVSDVADGVYLKEKISKLNTFLQRVKYDGINFSNLYPNNEPGFIGPTGPRAGKSKRHLEMDE